MKILHVADFLPELHDRAGGAEFVARRIIHEQAAIGVKIDVVTLPADKTPDNPPWQQHYEMHNLDPAAPKLAYAVKQLYFPADPLARRDLKRIIAESRPDVVHYHNLHFAGLSVVSVAREMGIPSVWSIYDYWIFCPAFMLLTNDDQLCTRGHGAHCVDCIGTKRLPALKPVKKALFATRPQVFARPVAAVDNFVVLSEASRDLLQHHGVAPQRIETIPQYIWTEAAQCQQASTPKKGRMLYVGWVERRKGLHVVIGGLIQAAKDFPELHLDVLGLPANPEYQTEMEQWVADAGLTDRVNFRGKLSRDDLLQELQTAYLVCVPEQWENMSPVILTEAMAAGACVLASRVGGIRQFVEEGRSGLLAERTDESDWAEQMRYAMEHPEEVVAMGQAARQRALEVFDPDTLNQKLVDMYQSLMDKQSVGSCHG